MSLPTRTKVRRPDLAEVSSWGDRVGWVAPPGHFPTVTAGHWLDQHEMPNTRTTVLTDPPDESGQWVVGVPVRIVSPGT